MAHPAAGSRGKGRVAGGRACRLAALALAALLSAKAQADPSTAILRVTVPTNAVAEVLFDWSAERCETWDIPDAPARAWRAADGSVRVLAAHHRARPLSGPDLDRLGHTCTVAFEGGKRDDPAAHDDLGWLAAPWTVDGRTVHALVHMEWHGHKRPERCRGRAADCWRNSITYAVSHDGGHRFDRPTHHRVAALAPVTAPDQRGRAGLFNPSNIVTGGSCRFATVFAEAQPGQKRGVCLLRNCDGEAPRDWTAWDGRSFAAVLDGSRSCAPVSPGTLKTTLWSIVRHEPSGLHVGLTAATIAPEPGAGKIAGIWAVTSPDLIAWSAPQLVLAAPLNTAPDCARDTALSYPSIIDADSDSPVFDSTDGQAFLYLTRFRVDGCKLTADRDLIRLPLTINPFSTPDSDPHRTAGAAPHRPDRSTP